MCGIAGLVDPNNPPGLNTLEQMAEPLVDRGPDDFGYFLNENIGLVHRRLSIIDVKGGHQPIFNEQKNLAIIFNGEIYDYKILQKKLIAKGHQFKTASDTEVLLHLYEDYGPRFINQINGMFAFAILHIDNGKIFLARDRFGQKPLFFAHKENRFAFASGPRSLTNLSWIDTSIDLTAINDYLEYQYIPTPKCIYKGIRKLPPGNFALWEKGVCSIHSYWHPSISSDYRGTYNQAQEELRSTLANAVEKRLVADVPLGMFLSGGIDSSLICALAQKKLDQPALTFSIGFPEKNYDERQYSELVAKHLGTDHHFLEVIANDFQQLKSLVQSYEEPFCDASMLPTTLLSRFTKKKVTVALSGDGADELFGGYDRYRVMHLMRYLTVVPQSIRRVLGRIILSIIPSQKNERTIWGRLRRVIESLDIDGLTRYLSIISRCPEQLKQEIYGEQFQAVPDMKPSINVLRNLSHPHQTQSEVDAIMELDMKSYLNDDILTKVDRASMSCGLEVRSPFLDVEVAQLAMTLPYSWKQKGINNKRILVDTFKELLPQEIFNRSKMGFGVPLARWFREDWYAFTQSLLLEGKLVQKNYFGKEPLSRLLKSHLEMKKDFSYLLFALIILELWIEQAEVSG